VEHIDIKVFSVLALGTAALIGGIKKAFPAWIANKEPLLAVVIPIALIIVFKATGTFKGTDWADALLWAFGAGMGAGVFHDKALNPLMAGKNDGATGGAK